LLISHNLKMSALVPYALRRAAQRQYIQRYGRSLRNPYAKKLLSALAPTAQKYGASVIQRAYKRYRTRRTNIYKRSAIRSVGQPLSAKVGAKHTQTAGETPGAGKDSRTLFNFVLTNIERGTAINQALRDSVVLHGFKICLYFENLSSDQVLNLNWAIVSPKKGASMYTQNFFRSNSGERAINFDEDGLTANDYHCRAINTDEFEIFCHKRLNILRRNNNNGLYARSINYWQKINRLITFENVGETRYCATPIFLIYWYATRGTGPNPQAVAQHLKVDFRSVAYFREPS
jgi:hypothetical protein